MGLDQEGFVKALAGVRRVALDTNACIYFLQREEERAPLVAEIVGRAASGALAIELSGVVLMELLIHPLRSGDLHELNRIRLFTERQQGVNTVDVSRSVAFASAAVRALTGLKLPDAVVAGSAAVSGCDAIVGNDRGFARLNEHRTLQVMSLGSVLRIPRYIQIDDFADTSVKQEKRNV